MLMLGWRVAGAVLVGCWLRCLVSAECCPALQTKQQKIEREMEEGRSRGPALSPGTQRILRTQRRSGAAAAQHAAAMGLTQPLQVRLATAAA